MSRLATEDRFALDPDPLAMGRSTFPFRILVVDDEPSICALNARALANCGYRVDAVENGSAAWQILQLQSYDLMITDNNMPKLSGLELIRNLRAASIALPIIMASGLPPHDEFDRDPVLKPHAILNKPYTVGELLEAVAGVLQTSAASRRPAMPPVLQPEQ